MNGWAGWRGRWNLGLLSLRKLCFSRTPGRDALENLDRTRFAVDEQFKVTAIETFNELALLIDDRDRRLYQLGIDAHHVVLRECAANCRLGL